MSRPLEDYRRRRDFAKTPEPEPGTPAQAEAPRFVVQKHDARRLHWDFRLEWAGVLWSWAVPKGPSLDPKERRLAVRTEDHPIEYAGFEGVIPEGEYGAGPVIIWDQGTWTPRGDPAESLRSGKLAFDLEGERMRGRWNLVRTGAGDREQWLLIKGRDDEAAEGAQLVEAHQTSVVSGRTLADVNRAPDRVWRESAIAVEGEPKARPAAFPERIEPQLATAVSAPPEGSQWLHELKVDGYRVLAHLRAGSARLHTRKGQDWTRRFGPIAAALAALPIQDAVLDGEIVVYGPGGRSDFGALQEALSTDRCEGLHYLVFDLLHADGHDLRAVPLVRRKELLRALVEGAPRIRYADHVRGQAHTFMEQACRLGLEGVVSKRADAPYRSGRTRSWTKAKCVQRQEFVVGGYTTSEAGLAALILGVWEDGGLAPVGKVGTGFSSRQRRELPKQLARLDQEESPFARSPGVKEARFVRPELVAEVSFAESTRAGRLRHPSFLGFREDKDPRQVRDEPAARPLPQPSQAARAALRSVKVTNPDRELWEGVTKAELLRYWMLVSKRALPWLVRRPLTLVRCPSGVGGQCFYQRHSGPGLPDPVKRLRRGDDELLWVDDLEGVLALAQMAALELHPWGARVDDPDRPDLLLFDLDPGEETPWPRIAETAFRLRDHLEELGLRCGVRTTGGKGLHVVLPFAPGPGWEEARELARAVAAAVVRQAPDALTLSHSLAGRRGRLYIDVLRNAPGATAIGSWSPRARPGAPVAVPLFWDEVLAVGAGDRFDLQGALTRLAALDLDPWEPLLGLDQALPLR